MDNEQLALFKADPSRRAPDIFYNTIHLEGDSLKEAQKNNLGLNERIKDFFQRNKARVMTPWEVLREMRLDEKNIVQVRRSISDLTTGGFLIKTRHMRVELEGKSNHCWKWALSAMPKKLNA